jgi:hypothetical protein
MTKGVKTRFEKRLHKLEQQTGVARLTPETKTWVIYIVSEAGQRDIPYAEIVWSKELGSTMTLLATNQT